MALRVAFLNHLPTSTMILRCVLHRWCKISRATFGQWNSMKTSRWAASEKGKIAKGSHRNDGDSIFWYILEIRFRRFRAEFGEVEKSCDTPEWTEGVRILRHSPWQRHTSIRHRLIHLDKNLQRSCYRQGPLGHLWIWDTMSCHSRSQVMTSSLWVCLNVFCWWENDRKRFLWKRLWGEMSYESMCAYRMSESWVHLLKSSLIWAPLSVKS